MSWKGEIKQFASVDIDGKTVLVFREKYVRKKAASKILDLFIENYPKLNKEDKKKYDFLIINKTGITASYKKGVTAEPSVCWLKNVEFKDITIADSTPLIGGKYDKPINIDPYTFSINYKTDFYDEK